MNPDDTNTNPLDAAYAVVLDMLRPDPKHKECSPLNWDTTEFPDTVEL